MPTTTVYARREAAEGTTLIQKLIIGGHARTPPRRRSCGPGTQMTCRRGTSRFGSLMRRPFASIVVSLMVVSCAPAEKTMVSGSPTAASSPIAVPTASATAAPATFPDLPVLIATGADLQRYRSGKWELVARVCPGATTTGRAIAELLVTSDGTRALVVCWQTPAGATDAGFARETYIVDLASGVIKEIAPVGYGVGALSPDGKQLIVGAWVRSSDPTWLLSHWSIRDLASGNETEILPPGNHFMYEWRWTVLGSSYFQPVSFGGGGVSRNEAGTFLWTGVGWRKLSDARLIEAASDGSAVLEFTDSMSSADRRVGVIAGGVERVLTPQSVTFEQAVARLGDGRVVAWRPGTRGLPGGYMVIYAPNGTPTLFPGDFGFWWVHDNRWLVGTDSSNLYAFDVASGHFASLQTGRSIDALALLPH